MVHVAALERLVIEPNRVGLFVVGEHAVLEIEYFSQQKHKELFLDTASVVSVFVDEHDLERFLEIISFLLGKLIESILNDVITANEQSQQRIDRVDCWQEYGCDILSPGFLESNVHLDVGVGLEEQRLGSSVKYKRVVAEEHSVILFKSEKVKNIILNFKIFKIFIQLQENGVQFKQMRG